MKVFTIPIALNIFPFYKDFWFWLFFSLVAIEGLPNVALQRVRVMGSDKVIIYDKRKGFRYMRYNLIHAIKRLIRNCLAKIIACVSCEDLLTSTLVGDEKLRIVPTLNSSYMRCIKYWTLIHVVWSA